jgi:hypothetical protein
MAGGDRFTVPLSIRELGMEGKFSVREELGGVVVGVDPPPLAVIVENTSLPFDATRLLERPLAEAEDSARVFDSRTSRSISVALRLIDPESRLVDRLLPPLGTNAALVTTDGLLPVGDGPVNILLRLALEVEKLRRGASSPGAVPDEAV